MRRLMAAITVTVFALAAVAQQPRQCVNPQLLDGLVFQGRSEVKVSVKRGDQAFMDGLRMPAGLALIGSGVRGGTMTSVAYRSTLGTDKAFAAVAAALGADGWQEEAAAGASSTFNVAGAPRDATFCRDARRRHVMVNEVAGAQYVNIGELAQERQHRCNESPTSAIGPGLHAGPRFQFPEGTGVAPGGGGGSSTFFTTSTRITSAQTPVALVAHLASQLESQGWHPDSQWSGNDNAGSTWRRTGDGEITSGLLEIMRVGEGTYDVDFTLALPQ